MNTTAIGAQLVRLPAPFLPAMLRALAHGRSPMDAATLLRQMGYETGEAFHAALEEWLAGRGPAGSSDSLGADEFWDAFAGFWAENGWGTVRHVQLHPGIGALDCTDWIEAQAAAEAGQSGCHLTTGIFADLLGRIAGGDVAVMEVECASAGGERCRFLFGGTEALGGVYTGMTEGLSYDQALAHLG
ncbi:MAG: hypothetical protein JO040_06765 [Gemmatimonadetes bacterium]|nr:hypothetical protein [Gemmatimonadota bacterium]